MQAITVSKLNTYIKQIFDSEEFLHNIPVEGEIFGVSSSRNVIYFSLKDDNASLQCVCFYPNFIDDIVEGEKVIVTGSPNYYIKGGKLNFNVIKVEKQGQGKLYEEFIKLKERLESEGLFDNKHKKSIPKNIKRLGVITSKEGAVIQDIKNVAWRRNPSLDIVLYNTKVQGRFAENEIAHAIDVMGKYENVDAIVVARGGGSLEDLWAYNTEIVARATYNCKKPIISAVGHETDFTIIDFVSDLRAPTPSAAAELLTFDLSEKKEQINNLIENYFKVCQYYLTSKKNNIDNLTYLLSNKIEKYLLGQDVRLSKQKIAFLNAFENVINQKYYEIGILENTLNKINPKEILKKGYARIEQHNQTIGSKKEIDFQNELNIIFKDGEVRASPKKEV